MTDPNDRTGRDNGGREQSDRRAYDRPDRSPRGERYERGSDRYERGGGGHDRGDRYDRYERGENGKTGYEGKRQMAQDVKTLEAMKVDELETLAHELGVSIDAKLKKADLVAAIVKSQTEGEGLILRQGILDILPEGYGFLRTKGCLPSEDDIYVSQSQIRRFNLRRGDEVNGQVRKPKDSEKYFALLKISTVNRMDPDTAKQRKFFENLTPLYPEERLQLERKEPTEITGRIIDLIAPIGKGQRGLIVSPPKAGKTTILKQIANSITANNPEVHLMVLLVDERPEEVTDMERSVKGEVVSSTFDQPPENHIAVTELVLERAKRLVEEGRDVVILVDSITRMARAYNLTVPPSGRILSGGVDSTALYPPKRFFGAARNIEFGGSLTIIATALVDTGSRMDEVIFEEFKGTGNMELHLDRRVADKRIFPAIDLEKSGTRKEELLLPPEEAQHIWKLRRVLHALDQNAALELLIKKIKDTKSNSDFLMEIQKSNVQ